MHGGGPPVVAGTPLKPEYTEENVELVSPSYKALDSSFIKAGNTKGGSITVPLTFCLTGLESAVGQLTIILFICKMD
jgi:hypothetical protein